MIFVPHVTMFNFYKKSILIVFMATFALATASCSKSKSKASDKPIANVGKPGEIKASNTIKKNESVHVLEKDEKITFIKDSGEAFVEHSDDRIIKPGDILIANEDQKYLLRVKEVTEQKGTKTHVVTRQGSITDIALKNSEGAFSLSATPKYDLADLDNYIKKSKKAVNTEEHYSVNDQGHVSIRNLELFNLKINDENNLQLDSSRFFGSSKNAKYSIGASVGGSYSAILNEAKIEVTPTLRNSAEFSGLKITNMESRIDAVVKYKVDVTYKSEGSAKFDINIPILPEKTIPVRVPGPVPVYLDIELSVPLSITFKTSGKNETRVVYEAEYEFYTMAKYNKADGMVTGGDKRVNIVEKSINTNSKTLKLNAELSLKPTISARLYRVLGPYAYFQPYLRGELEYPQRFKKDDLFVGVGGGVGFEVSEPIFKKELVSYDSGRIKQLDFFKSWDLDSFNGAPVMLAKVENINSITVDQITDEGFVVINAKTISKDPFSRFELLEQTKAGILVPSEDFFTSGKLYYYPLNRSDKDNFKLRVILSSGDKHEVTIPLTVSAEVQDEVKKDRFGITTNSYKVATEGSDAYSDKVPGYNVGTGLIATILPVDKGVREFLNRCFKILNSFTDDREESQPQSAYSDEKIFELITNNCARSGNDMRAFEDSFHEYMKDQKPKSVEVLSKSPKKMLLDINAHKSNYYDYVNFKYIHQCLENPIQIDLNKGLLRISKPKCTDFNALTESDIMTGISMPDSQGFDSNHKQQLRDYSNYEILEQQYGIYNVYNSQNGFEILKVDQNYIYIHILPNLRPTIIHLLESDTQIFGVKVNSTNSTIEGLEIESLPWSE